MGLNGVDKPENIVQYWQNVCAGLAGLPFISQSLWQVGPMPWLMGNGSWFQNCNWGAVGDSFQRTATDGNSGSSKTSVPEGGFVLTEEEKKELNNKKRVEQRQLTNKFNKLKPIMEEFSKTLDENNTEECGLKFKIEDAIKSCTKDNYDSLLKIFNDYKTRIQKLSLDKAKKNVTSSSKADYKTHVEKLNTNLSKPSQNFGILDDGEWDEDIDIMEFLSTWNSTDTTKSKHIVSAIGEKRKAATGDKRSHYDTLTNAVHDELASRADAVDKEGLSEETKKLLNDAIKQFEKFDDNDKRFPKGDESGLNYSKAFDNLYRAIRLAEAEIADKELKEQYDFLGEQNPFKNSPLLTETKTDLKSESLENMHTDIAEPVAESTEENEGTPPPIPPKKANILGSKYNEGERFGLELLSYVHSLNQHNNTWNNKKAGQMLLDVNKINKETVIGVIDAFNGKLTEDGFNQKIIEKLSMNHININACNRIVKAVMRKALDIGLNADNCSAYNALATYFDATGTPKYKNDGYTPDNGEGSGNTDSFQFKHDYQKDARDGYNYTPQQAKEIDNMLNALIEEIKKCNQST